MVARSWQHRFAGVPTQTYTHDLECAGCKARGTLIPWRAINIERVFGLLMLPAIIPGLIFLSSARRKARAWQDNPVVEGAVSPGLPRQPEPRRRCDCGGLADCTAIIRLGTTSMPLGTRRDYRCVRCERPFGVHDGWGMVSMALIGVALSGAGSFIIAFPPGAAVGAEASNSLFGVALVVFGALAFVLFAARVHGRATHPLTDE